MSDLNGDPQAEKSVKLPNPFYYIPQFAKDTVRELLTRKLGQ